MPALKSAFNCLLLSIIASNVHAQSNNPNAEAKQHYQNAVAAIAKSDWVSAKRELMLAENLESKNALIHYDLALANFHTGDKAAATTELGSALSLGLPADQQQAAEELRRQLQSGSTEQAAVSEVKKSPDSSAEIRLICTQILHNENTQRNLPSATYVINKSHATINGAKYDSLRVTDSEIIFLDPVQGGATFSVSINRYSGSFLMAPKSALGAIDYVDGQCSALPSKRF